MAVVCTLAIENWDMISSPLFFGYKYPWLVSRSALAIQLRPVSNNVAPFMMTCESRKQHSSARPDRPFVMSCVRFCSDEVQLGRWGKPHRVLSAWKPPRIRGDRSFVQEMPKAINKYGLRDRHADASIRSFQPYYQASTAVWSTITATIDPSSPSPRKDCLGLRGSKEPRLAMTCEVSVFAQLICLLNYELIMRYALSLNAPTTRSAIDKFKYP